MFEILTRADILFVDLIYLWSWHVPSRLCMTSGTMCGRVYSWCYRMNLLSHSTCHIIANLQHQTSSVASTFGYHTPALWYRIQQYHWWYIHSNRVPVHAIIRICAGAGTRHFSILRRFWPIFTPSGYFLMIPDGIVRGWYQNAIQSDSRRRFRNSSGTLGPRASDELLPSLRCSATYP